MKNSFNYILTLCALFLCQGIMAQATYEGNDNGGPPGSFLGWDNSVLFPLEVRHDAYFPILFSTNNTNRMRIVPWGNVFVGYSGFTNLPPDCMLDSPIWKPLRAQILKVLPYGLIIGSDQRAMLSIAEFGENVTTNCSAQL